jgi:hypothetical protein
VDPGCLSRITDPDFTHLGSQIQKQQQKRGAKKIFCHTLVCSHKFHNFKNYFIFEIVKKKICANFQKFQNYLPKKLSLSFQKYGFGIWDPGSKIPNPGVKRHHILDPDTQH